jgi:hypothetical protein
LVDFSTASFTDAPRACMGNSLSKRKRGTSSAANFSFVAQFRNLSKLKALPLFIASPFL